MWMAGACGLKRAAIANGRRYFPIHNVKQRRTHRRKPGDDDAELHCRDATSIRVFLHACQESLPRTDGRRSLWSQDVFAPQRGRRSAERRTNSCRASMRRRGRGPVSGTARLSALLRGHAPGFPTRPGPRFLESPDANGRTLSGTSAASTSQSGTRRTG
jgi:hypothetical protein